MELIRTIREKHTTAMHNDFQRQAEETICLADFADNLYIAFNGVPYDPIDTSWTSKEIVERLNALRQNYVNAKMKNYVSRSKS
jgi:hypothetical protein